MPASTEKLKRSRRAMSQFRTQSRSHYTPNPSVTPGGGQPPELSGLAPLIAPLYGSMGQMMAMGQRGGPGAGGARAEGGLFNKRLMEAIEERQRSLAGPLSEQRDVPVPGVGAPGDTIGYPEFFPNSGTPQSYGPSNPALRNEERPVGGFRHGVGDPGYNYPQPPPLDAPPPPMPRDITPIGPGRPGGRPLTPQEELEQRIGV
jgi:hypothetical protein